MAGGAGLTPPRRRWVPAAAIVLLLAPACRDADPTVSTTAGSIAPSSTAGSASSTSPAPTSLPSLPSTTSTTSTTPPGARTVVLVGDSLAVEASPYLLPLLHEIDPDIVLTTIAIGGTAPCDFVRNALPFAVDIAELVVMSFNGNSFTDCTHDESGAHRRGQALIDQYRSDLTTLLERARAAGASVLLVEQPLRRDDAATNGVIVAINAMIAEFAASARERGDRQVAVALAGSAVESADGAFTMRLPCLPDEPSCGADGTNVVRSDDGVHFCPVAAHWSGRCSSYSSGAHRFALAIMEQARGLLDASG